ncbi:hypothetical protein BZG36_01963 [Bifiguratus adelaidae]|uniref:Coatomer subunit epsilon n=1 Tax=Bifiguratus adelaidae TaxID=1938954 RepID=A0A261Y3V0_9FUNG|nr:hypothetical protein BZG36_01963 [Bifiguratus adelaidae]
MESVDELFAVRNLFALGSYRAVINEIASLRSTLSDAAQQEAMVFQYRSLVALGEFDKVLQDVATGTSLEQQAIKALATYEKAKASHVAATMEAEVEKAQELAQDEALEEFPNAQVVLATVLLNHGLVDDALAAIHKRSKHLESSALAVQLYLQLDRLDLARKEMSDLKHWAEDAMPAQMLDAWVYLRLGGDKYQQAFYIFEEFAQSNNANTLKVLNSQAVNYLALAQYPEAESCLQEALRLNSNDPDTLINSLVLATLTNKSEEITSKYTSQLKQVAPEHPFVHDLDQKANLFDRAAAKYTVSA